MQQCPNCGYNNRAGVIFCENCGASLIGEAPLDTKSLNSSSETEKSQIGVDSSVLTDVKVQGTAVFEAGASLRLGIEGSPEPLLFQPKQETILGRRDPATGAMPDVDLTPFAGYRMGVSRRHAAIRHGDEHSLDLWDLGSSNGTFLNGQRLSAHRPYRLRDADEIRLGQMVIRIYFQPAEKPAKAPEPAEVAQPEAVAPAPKPEAVAPAPKPSAPEPEAVAPAAPAPEPEAVAPAPRPSAPEPPAAEEAKAAPPITEPLESPADEQEKEQAAGVKPPPPVEQVDEVPVSSPKPAAEAAKPKPEDTPDQASTPEPDAPSSSAEDQASAPPQKLPEDNQKRD